MASLLKDIYNPTFFDGLTRAMKLAMPKFDEKAFLELVFDAEWQHRELKQRMKHLAVVLHRFLSGNYKRDVATIGKVMVQAWKHQPKEQSLAYMFVPEYIAMFGLDDFAMAMQAMELVTQYTSCEFAIRPFLIKYPEETMAQMRLWSKHDSYLVRRFSSEGCRPRLPWAMAIPGFKKNPAPVLPILENLKNDPSEYVRRSVANNLNDIARDHPGVVMEIAARWKGKTKETDWIIKHGCRTLLKKANQETLILWGLSPSPDCSVSDFNISSTVIPIGDRFTFSFDLVSNETAPIKLRIEYGIDYVKNNGKHSRKLFKVTENTFQANRVYSFKRQHSFRNLTTRKHYVGKHRIAILINGIEMASEAFSLV